MLNIKRYFRLKHFIKVITCFFSDSFTIKSNKNYAAKTLLIIKTEAIGDYFHFRNFLEDIRKSNIYQQYKITLCGNILYREIAESFDSNAVDNFIWISRKEFSSNTIYRKKIISEINSAKFEIAIQPNYSREILIGDSIIRASNAKERIGCAGDTANDIWPFKFIANFWYTKLLNLPKDLIWEFDRNKAFFEKLLKTKINKNGPQLNYPKQHIENYIILFPGAGEKIKQWPELNFAQIARYVAEKYQTDIKICGASNDFKTGQNIINMFGSLSRVENLCGTTSLTELVDIISKAKLLITNDSSALHIAACLNTQTICLLMGRHYGRFAPYPKAYNKYLSYIYPDSITQLLKNKQLAIKKTRYKQPADISEISVIRVIQEIDKILKN